MSSTSNGQYSNVHLRFTLQIRIVNILSSDAEEEFSAYLHEPEALQMFVTFADEFSDVSIGIVDKFLWTVSFSCKGELPVWIDDPVSYATSIMKHKFSYSAAEIYMDVDPIRFVLVDVIGMEYE